MNLKVMMMVVVMVLWNQRFEQCHMDRGQVVSTKLHQASYDDWVDIIIAKPEESIDNFLSFVASVPIIDLGFFATKSSGQDKTINKFLVLVHFKKVLKIWKQNTFLKSILMYYNWNVKLTT